MNKIPWNYRGIQLTVDGKFIVLFYEPGVTRIEGRIAKNGTKIISIPEGYCGDLLEYGKRIVDRTYEWATYHKKFEERHLLP